MSVKSVLISPKTIAVVGASEDIRKPGGKTLENLLRYNFEGEIYPVNPKYKSIMGLKCYPTILDIPKPIDVAILAIPSHIVLKAIEQCIIKKVKYVVIYSSGFSELLDPEKVKLEEKLRNMVKNTSTRLIGPNSEGYMIPLTNTYAIFSSAPEASPISGEVAFISQSGALGASLITRFWELGYGISCFISTGNEADMTFVDFIKIVLDDPNTKAVTGFIEQIRKSQRFIEISKKALKRRKPIIVFKAGKSEKGKFSARTHTGAVAGSYEIYNAVLKQYGVIEVDELEDLIYASIALAWQPIPKGDRLGFITISGGSCSVMADLCEKLKLVVSDLSENTIKKLKKILPEFAIAKKPLDITGGALSKLGDIMCECLYAMAEDDNVDMVIIGLTTLAGVWAEDAMSKLIPAIKDVNQNHQKPVYFWWSIARSVINKHINRLLANKIPYSYPEKAVKAAYYASLYGRYLKRFIN